MTRPCFDKNTSKRVDLTDSGSGLERQLGRPCSVWGGFRDPISHRPIAVLPLLPHAHQRRVAGVHEIDDPNVILVDVVPMQPTGVLLQRSLLRDRHREDKRVERRMVEALAHQLARR
jgi:hypothetical protein